MALKTPISILQEIMVSKKQALPDYSFESIGDLLNPQFCCTVKSSSVTAIAVGRNKKEAKQKAASNALQQLQNFNNVGFSHQDVKNESNAISKIIIMKELPKGYCEGTNYVGMLNEYAPVNRSVTTVRYEDLQVIANGQFQVNCIYDKKITYGFAGNKKQAKQIAAFEMLQFLKTTKKPVYCKDEMDAKAITEFQKRTPTITSSRKNTNVEPLSGIKQEDVSLEEAIEKLDKLKLTYHVETLQTKPFIVAVQLKNSLITGMGKGDNEHMATANAMNRVLSTLNEGCSLLN